VENLEWCTPKENIHHANFTLGVGLNPNGKSMHRKLNEFQVLTIVTLNGIIGHSDIADYCMVSKATISHITRGFTYPEITKGIL